MNKLRLSNEITGHELWIASNAYIQKTTSIRLVDEGIPEDEVLIGQLKDVYLYGNRYPSNTLPKEHFIRQYSEGMWIKVGKQFFEVSAAHICANDCNREMLENESIGFIDEILNKQGETCDIYINASITPAAAAK